ncbi:MAG: ATP-dependent zinc metalloprotease FtsH [Candidatus Omnitrophica bacterium]|nr:ATP-dependent zinc metalloprotease FtsH [Candidatus Omnitrophota bacterium]MCM8830673.1 ATP-dependent zinc metalloprotease FtsH [Candidatus Omnitrophota bacterium]
MNKKDNKTTDQNLLRNISFFLILLLGVLFLGNIFTFKLGVKDLSYSEFYNLVEKNLETPTIRSVKKINNLIEGEFTPLGIEKIGGGSLQYFKVYIPDEDKEIISILRKNVNKFEIEPPRTFWTNVFYSLPTLLLLGFLWFSFYRGSQIGSHVWSFGKARVQVIEKEKAPKVTFRDVAGIDEAKEELKEIIEFLKDPKKFQRLGGRIPKGVLLVGPPGCGKTLLAKAVAGEADVHFFNISGSDFVELFVGVGASRVRDLFDQAKKAARLTGKGAIIFIDEIDAVGRLRFAGIGGGHDEREQTLNQLLVEMDGFGSETGIIVMAATNRPDVLDPALLRPGRFDRHIVIYPPDIKGREEILKVHTRKIKLAKDVDLAAIARQTPGFSGADLENLCNEAALLAARLNKDAVTQAELLSAIERVMMGPEKKSRIISVQEKKLTAYHEAGHALLSLLIPEVNPMTKVSIIPRGMAGGYTFVPPKEDRHYRLKKELLGEITMALGGRASEEIIFGDITTGATKDLEEVTLLARKMVCDYGMSQRLGYRTFGKSQGPIFLGRDLVEEKDYSEETAKIIDEEIKKIVDECYARAKQLLIENKEKLINLANALLEKEVLDAAEAKKIIGQEDTTNQDLKNTNS